MERWKVCSTWKMGGCAGIMGLIKGDGRNSIELIDP